MNPIYYALSVGTLAVLSGCAIAFGLIYSQGFLMIIGFLLSIITTIYGLSVNQVRRPFITTAPVSEIDENEKRETLEDGVILEPQV